MSYRKAMILLVLALLGCTGYDAWVVLSGNLHTSSYVPGLYPLTCIGWMVGVRMMKNRGLWNSP